MMTFFDYSNGNDEDNVDTDYRHRRNYTDNLCKDNCSFRTE